MTMDRDELLAREERAWDAFWAEVAGVPEERRSAGDVVPGWSVHDLVWHCAAWADFAGEHFESLEPGPFVDPFDAHDDADWDGVNDDIATASKAMSWDEVVEGTQRARVRARAALTALPDVSDAAAAWFGEETFVHYDEHALHVRAFLDG
ncbi:MAG TPA: DinB family protein [Actinomycetota bacterium]